MIQVHLLHVYNLLIYNLEKQYENFCTAVIDLQETVYGSKAYFKTLKESNPKLVSILYKKLITVNTVCFSFLKQKSRIFLRKKSKISSFEKIQQIKIHLDMYLNNFTLYLHICFQFNYLFSKMVKFKCTIH